MSNFDPLTLVCMLCLAGFLSIPVLATVLIALEAREIMRKENAGR